MSRKLIIESTTLFLVSSVFLLLFHSRPMKTNNTTPANQLITKDHGLEKLLLAEAIFNVRKGFEEVTATDLSKEVGLKLECKRQVAETQFYYVIIGSGYRCFIITDSDDVVQEVLVVHHFATIVETQKCLDRYSNDDIHITEMPEHGFRELWRDIGHSSIYRNSLFTLQDGVMILQSIGDIAPEKYFYFTDEEWKDAYDDWCGFMILPIDKQPW